MCLKPKKYLLLRPIQNHIFVIGVKSLYAEYFDFETEAMQNDQEVAEAESAQLKDERIINEDRRKNSASSNSTKLIIFHNRIQ